MPQVEVVVSNQYEPDAGWPLGRLVCPTRLARSTSALKQNTRLVMPSAEYAANKPYSFDS